MELGVMGNMGYEGYFLIVQDFINWGKSQGIVFGPGRGSAAGSIIAYALNITDLDPLKYGLLFERFLNPRYGLSQSLWEMSELRGLELFRRTKSS